MGAQYSTGRHHRDRQGVKLSPIPIIHHIIAFESYRDHEMEQVEKETWHDRARWMTAVATASQSQPATVTPLGGSPSHAEPILNGAGRSL